MIPSVKVGAHRYKIIVMSKSWLGESDSYGQCNSSELTIRISGGLQNSRILETLLHEIGHAIWHEYGIQEGESEEQIVSKVFAGMAAVFINNPKLIGVVRELTGV